MQDNGGMQGGDGEVQAVAPHPDGQADTAQSRPPLQLPRGLQLMVLAGIRVQHGLYLQCTVELVCQVTEKPMTPVSSKAAYTVIGTSRDKQALHHQACVL